jgi:hypothetical protein
MKNPIFFPPLSVTSSSETSERQQNNPLPQRKSSGGFKDLNLRQTNWIRRLFNNV